MRTVKGEVLTTIPVSISKAASILSKFVSADTGASQAICAYLRRASVSFNELNQLHKELKSHRKHKTPESETVIEDGEPTRSFISGQHDGEESERKKHKKKKNERGWFGNIVKSEGGSVEDKVRIKIEERDFGVEDVKKKHKQKRGEVANLEEGKGGKVKIEEVGNVGIEDNDRKKHKKNKGENGGKILVEEEEEMKKKKKKKKRKSEEIEEGRETNSEESRSKKKKKRKIEREG